MNRIIKILCLAGLLSYPASYASAWCNNCGGDESCCPCPGKAQWQCMYPYSSCEEACYGRSGGPEKPRRDYDVERRAREAAAKEKANELLEKGLTATGDGDLDAALRHYEEAKKVWPDIGTYKSRYGGYTTVDGLIAEIKREKRNQERTGDSKKRTGELADQIRRESGNRSGTTNSELVLKEIKEPPASGKSPAPKAAGQDDPTARASRKAVAEKQAQALTCATGELQELANGMGEEGAMLRAELNAFLVNLRQELSKPCSGQPDTQNIQTLSLSDLTKGAKKKEDHLEASILVTRDEETCEVRLDVQHASSLKSGSSSRSPGTSSREGQILVRMDKTGGILDSETPAGVGKCLSGLSARKN